MKTKEFGEIVVLFPKEELPTGIVLRERADDSVILEECYDATGMNVDVLHVFEDCSLQNREDFVDCIITARQYEDDLNVPIYIVSAKSVDVPEDELEMAHTSKNNNAECLRCMVEWQGKRPWSMSPPNEKCSQCLKRKASE